MAFTPPELTAENFKAVALSFYDHSDSISMLEFDADLKRFQHVANLLGKFSAKSNVRLILNHIIILHNCFGIFTTIGLTFKTAPEARGTLRTFLEFLSLIPEDYPLWNFPRDDELFQRLNEI